MCCCALVALDSTYYIIVHPGFWTQKIPIALIVIFYVRFATLIFIDMVRAKGQKDGRKTMAVRICEFHGDDRTKRSDRIARFISLFPPFRECMVINFNLCAFWAAQTKSFEKKNHIKLKRTRDFNSNEFRLQREIRRLLLFFIFLYSILNTHQTKLKRGSFTFSLSLPFAAFTWSHETMRWKYIS